MGIYKIIIINLYKKILKFDVKQIQRILIREDYLNM